MIPELGNFALVLALSLSLLLGVLPMLGVYRNNHLLMSLSRPLCAGIWVFMLVSFGCLAHAFLTDDFSVPTWQGIQIPCCRRSINSRQSGGGMKARCCYGY